MARRKHPHWVIQTITSIVVFGAIAIGLWFWLERRRNAQATEPAVDTRHDPMRDRFEDGGLLEHETVGSERR